MKKKIIALSLAITCLVFVTAKFTLAKDDEILHNQIIVIPSKHGPVHINTLESIIELCNLYELTNHSLPLFCLNCGNGVLEPSEQCDDGNNLKNDGCNADCSLELPRSNEPLFLLDIKA